MWRLEEFQFDWGIPGDEVTVFDADGEPQLLSKSGAIAMAHAQGFHLVPEWPTPTGTEPVFCSIVKLELPVRWERAPSPHIDDLDPELWFVGWCGGRDLLYGNPHTFTGRMSAWCPAEQVGYNVSLSEIEEMSVAAEYFVRGYLAGNEPEPPSDAEGNEDPGDMTAWRSAVTRFNRTGSWLGRWRTCASCGCVLLPDSMEATCSEHADGPDHD